MPSIVAAIRDSMTGEVSLDDLISLDLQEEVDDVVN